MFSVVYRIKPYTVGTCKRIVFYEIDFLDFETASLFIDNVAVPFGCIGIDIVENHCNIVFQKDLL